MGYKVSHIDTNGTVIRPEWYSTKKDYWFSDDNWAEYQKLVNDIGSVQFQDSWKRFRIDWWLVYIGDWIIKAFSWTTMYTVYTSDMSNTSKTISIDLWTGWCQWYFWENRILTKRWILDFDWNVITSFSYDSITPWLPWVVWANSWYDIYKWVVDWDNITFTKIWTWWTDQYSWEVHYWRLWAYLLNSNDMSWNRNSSYINPSTNEITNFTISDTSSSWSRHWWWYSWADGKFYRHINRNYWWWRMQKCWTWDEWFAWETLSTQWYDYWNRDLKFLWNIVIWWNWNWWTATWTWYWSNNYFIDTAWNLSKVQTNTAPYDSWICWMNWCIDENWYIYCKTWWWWSWIIFKTDKTFTDLNWKNPYLRR